jgi:esterase/lipase
MLKISKIVSISVIMLFLAISGRTSAADLQYYSSGALIQYSNGFTDQTIEGWNRHLNDVRLAGPLQEGCEPFYKTARGMVKGNVMLFHGYSACPQQYAELAAILAEHGYNVFVPLLPGHGRVPGKTGEMVSDQSAGMPDEKSAEIYKDFADNISEILKDEPGTKIVGGLSLGGVMAARAMIAHPDIYDRGFILAPFFYAAGNYGFLIPTVGKLFPERRISWGEDCENQRRLGRAGYCNFNITNISAIQSFGLETLKETKKIKKTVQVSGVEKDPSASNEAIAESKKKMTNSRGCFFAEGASHSMLSRFDNAGKDMFWLNPLLEQITRFVETGRRFDEVGNSEYGMKRCRSYN